MTGDGMLAAFPDPLDAIAATVQLQQALAEGNASDTLALRVRCGLNAGVSETRDQDVFGSAGRRACLYRFARALEIDPAELTIG